MNLFSRLIRRIPPFRNLYRRMDALRKENAALKKRAAKTEAELGQLSKQVVVLSAQQEKANAAFKKRATDMEVELNRLLKQVNSLLSTQQEMTEKLEALQKCYQAVSDRTRQNYNKLATRIGSNQWEAFQESEYYYFKGLDPSRYADALTEWYYHKTGQTLDLEHPRTYNEKIQWLKLYDSTPRKGELSDKYLVRDYVRKKIGEQYLIPLLGVWDRADDIPFDELPERFALKTTHGSKWNIIVQDKRQLDVKNTRKKLNKWLKTDFAFYDGLELHYHYIKPRVIAEEYIENAGGEINDYKVFCFDGKARYILFLTGRQTCLKKAVYDTSWNLMPFLDGGTRLEQEVPKPANLIELISLAEKLAEGFTHVRVDFYCLNNGAIKFGEMTFTPTSGQSLWDPEEYNLILGNLIHLPCDEREAQ